VQVGVVEWVGDLDHFSELKEVWIAGGYPPPPHQMVCLTSICSDGFYTGFDARSGLYITFQVIL
jgi:hypothetical protein